MVPMGGLRDFGVGVVNGQGGVARSKEGGSLAGKSSVGLEHLRLAYPQVNHKYSLAPVCPPHLRTEPPLSFPRYLFLPSLQH